MVQPCCIIYDNFVYFAFVDSANKELDSSALDRTEQCKKIWCHNQNSFKFYSATMCTVILTESWFLLCDLPPWWSCANILRTYKEHTIEEIQFFWKTWILEIVFDLMFWSQWHSSCYIPSNRFEFDFRCLHLVIKDSFLTVRTTSNSIDWFWVVKRLEKNAWFPFK